MTAEEILAKAAQAIEDGGWWQSRPYQVGPQPGQCAVTALHRHMKEGAWFEAMCAVAQEIGVHSDKVYGITVWNDAPGRTKEEVVSTLRNAKRWL